MKTLLEKRWVFVSVIFITFFISLYGSKALNLVITIPFPDEYWRYAYFTCCWLIGVPVLFLSLIYGVKNVLPELGLAKGLSSGLLWGFVITLPMLIGYAIVSEERNISMADLIAYCLLAALAEEILFRGFLFGQLSNHANWKLWMGALAEASVFGFVHLYQAENIMEAAGIFGITFLGGLWFGWLYIEWRYNLWLPIVLHMLMNAYWTIFHMGDNALGGTFGNIFRAAAILLSIIITYKVAKQKEIRNSPWPKILKP